jgi:aryl-alcohol dehydrogenase-like predicted oxidoreductase
MRKIGNTSIEVGTLAFGTNVFGWTVQEKLGFELLDRFVDSGLNMLDTADIYSKWGEGNSGGESETVIGNWLAARGNRDKVVVATKVGMEMAPDKTGLSKQHILSSAEDSLRRLRTDYIDLYQAHQDDAGTPLEESLEAFAALVEQGKVRAIGCSNYDAARTAEALAVSSRLGIPRYESQQPHYNLYHRAEYEAELEPLCRRENVSVFPYYSLASGFLTGKYRSEDDLGKSPRGRGMMKYLDGRGLAILKALDEVGSRTGSTPAQVSLAWLIARPGITAPIASATSVEQLDELIGSTRLELTADDLSALDHASS